jgi:hypothetical protein
MASSKIEDSGVVVLSSLWDFGLGYYLDDYKLRRFVLSSFYWFYVLPKQCLMQFLMNHQLTVS